MISNLSAALKKRMRSWARRRQGDDIAPVTLDRRRVYILPTRFGVIYGAVVFAMLLGSMNYNNSMGFALTFLLTGLGLVTMHHCHRNLAGLIVTGAQPSETFAGEVLKLQVGLENVTALRRYELEMECRVPIDTQQEHPALIHHIDPAARALTVIEVPTEKRGLFRPERLTISTRFPFGLFRAWSYVHLPIEALIYPHPAGEQAPPIHAATATGVVESSQRGAEDFRGFRSYVPGDSPRHIAWKAVARGGPLLVKDYSGAGNTSMMLDFDAVARKDVEARLSQLSKWVVEADRNARLFGLKLPNRRIAPRSGPAQRRRCLEALALHE